LDFLFINGITGIYLLVIISVRSEFIFCTHSLLCIFQISNNRVETGLLVGVIDVIPIDALKVPVAELVTMCGKKGNTKYKFISHFMSCYGLDSTDCDADKKFAVEKLLN